MSIRTLVDHLATSDEVIQFNLASSFGNFLTNLTESQPERVKRALDAELELVRTPAGIRLHRHLRNRVRRRVKGASLEGAGAWRCGLAHSVRGRLLRN